jgi:rhamnogalacturonyl hydrolase YesR
VEILELLPQDHPKRPALQQIFVKLARALSRTQGVTGEWDSLANLPGYSYPESSGTALVSYALARAVRQGWLDRSFLPVAERAFAAVTSRLQRTEAGLFSMPRISGPTNAFPKFTYKLVPQEEDKGYGVGSYLLAAAEFALLRRETSHP